MEWHAGFIASDPQSGLFPKQIMPAIYLFGQSKIA